MHIKRDISNWNIKIILSVVIQNYSVQFACWVQQFKFRVRPIRTPRSFLRKTTLRKSPYSSETNLNTSDSGLHHIILSAITEIYGQSTTYSEHIVNTFFGVFCNMIWYYVIISFFLTIKYYLILKYLINSW